MAKIVQTFKDDNGDVGSVRLKVGQSTSNEVCTILERPVTKIVLLLEQEEVRGTLMNWEHFKIIKLSWGEPCVPAPL